jgi:uncharacterized protein (DUF2141 family)
MPVAAAEVSDEPPVPDVSGSELLVAEQLPPAADELPVPDEQPVMPEPPAAAEAVEEAPAEAALAPEEPPPPPKPDMSTITVIVVNVETGSGMVNVAVCDTALSHEGCPYVHEIKAQPGFVETEFHDIPPGSYAVVGYHDVNGNNSFDKLLGMPREPYALSSKAADKLVPTFTDAAMPMKAGENAVIIRLKRLGG